jgi:hypothetical protein
MFQTGPDGLWVRARSFDAATEYHAPGKHSVEQMAVPFELLADCEGKKDEPVEIEARGDRQVTATWRDKGVPQLVQYEVAEPVDNAEFPESPGQLAENPPDLLPALHEAMLSTEPAPLRYATDTVQARGQAGKLIATDGRQLLVQSGFSFPWQEDLLISRSTIFGCRELPQDVPVAIGRSNDWVAVRIGPWTIWLAVNKLGRFPNVDAHIRQAADASSCCLVSDADAEFLIGTLPRLPSNDEYHLPVTFDLNGAVVVRAVSAEPLPPTEAVLNQSTWSGEPVRIHTDRRYLVRALQLGFRELSFFGAHTPVLCQADDRQFVWAVLAPEDVIPPGKNPIRIEPPADPAGTVPQQSQQTKKRTTMPKSNRHPEPADQNGQDHAATAAPEQPSGATEQAIALRDALRDATNKATELIRALQNEKKQARQLRSALASLREFQKLEI